MDEYSVYWSRGITGANNARNVWAYAYKIPAIIQLDESRDCRKASPTDGCVPNTQNAPTRRLLSLNAPHINLNVPQEIFNLNAPEGIINPNASDEIININVPHDIVTLNA